MGEHKAIWDKKKLGLCVLHIVSDDSCEGLVGDDSW